MPIYTDGLIINPGQNPLDSVVTGQFDAAEAAFDQAMFENPLSAAQRIQELSEASSGGVIRPGGTMMGRTRETIRAEPETPLLSAEDARARVKDAGLDLTIEDAGIREGALDILMERKRAENERKFVLQNAPASTVPIQLLAGFAASALDPINIASAFIPVVGQARYASMLARAGSRAARFGVRARVGAIEGAVGSALVEPLTLYASAQDQADYDMSDSLLNIAFGTVLGGGLHSVGGLVSDMRRGNLLDDASADLAPATQPGITARQWQQEVQPLRSDDDSMLMLRESLARGIEADRQQIAIHAERQAFEELAPAIRAELEAMAAGRLPNVADLKAESGLIDKRLAILDDEFKPRAKEFQRQGLSRKEAERAARDAVSQQRMELTQRRADIGDALDGNRRAEVARGELARLSRGELPEQFRPRAAERAAQITSGLDLRPSARSVAEALPWQVRESALRTAIAQAVTGRQVDVEDVIALADPVRRQQALERIKRNPEPYVDLDGQRVAAQVDESMRLDSADDLVENGQLLADEQALTGEVARQADLDVAAFTRAADDLVADAETYAAAYRAAALCQLRA